MGKFLVFLCVAVQVLGVTGCNDTRSVSDTSEINQEITEQVIYEDEYIKATYLGISDMVMSIALENKSDQEVTVLPMDSSVDGTIKQFTSGILATIQPGKTFHQGWILGATPTEEVEFSMSICGENMSELVRTDSLKIEVK